MSETRTDAAKANAARQSADYVKNHMIVGLGTGSTAEHLVRELGARVRHGLVFQGVATSKATERLARAVGLEMITADEAPRIDLTIDGADEVDPSFRLIKGGGGALLREKIIAAASDDYIIIADATKRVAQLGNFPLPVEITPFAAALTMRRLESELGRAGCTGRRAALRRAADGSLFISDGGNLIADCHCEVIPDPQTLASALDATAGVVEHGLFLNMARILIIGELAGAQTFTR